jgi:hypothetical protein
MDNRPMIIINRPWGDCSQNLLSGLFWHDLNGRLAASRPPFSGGVLAKATTKALARSCGASNQLKLINKH